MKRLIKTRINIAPYNVFQLDDCYIAELDNKEIFRTKHQHLATSFCQIKIAEEKQKKNEAIIRNIQELKAQGIL